MVTEGAHRQLGLPRTICDSNTKFSDLEMFIYVPVDRCGRSCRTHIYRWELGRSRKVGYNETVQYDSALMLHFWEHSQTFAKGLSWIEGAGMKTGCLFLVEDIPLCLKHINKMFMLELRLTQLYILTATSFGLKMPSSGQYLQKT